MTSIHTIPAALALATTLAITGCNRTAPSATDAGQTTGSTVQAAPPGDAASTPMPVGPAGLSNESTARQGNDLTNSTRATGGSNVYQSPSTDNPAPGNPGLAAAGSPSSAASQSLSSQSRGTSLPSN